MSTRIVERLWSCERRVREEFGREGKERKGKEKEDRSFEYQNIPNLRI